MAKRIIGRIEKVDFPELGFYGIEAKTDTGAYTSSIHCTDIHEQDGKLICNFYDHRGQSYKGKQLVFDTFDIAAVKSSNGMTQLRYLVKTKIILFSKTYTISLTLSARDEMRFPVLLGRKFLSKKFMVDPEFSFLSNNLPNK